MHTQPPLQPYFTCVRLVKTSTSTNLFKFLKINALFIKHMFICECDFNIFEWHMIFSIVQNYVQQLVLYDVTVRGRKELGILPKIEMLSLRNVKIEFSGEKPFDFDYITSIISTRNLRMLSYIDPTGSRSDKNDKISEFIANSSFMIGMGFCTSGEAIEKITNTSSFDSRPRLLEFSGRACMSLAPVLKMAAKFVPEQLNLIKYVLQNRHIEEIMALSIQSLLLSNCDLSRIECILESDSIQSLQIKFELAKVSNPWDVKDLCSLLRCCPRVHSLSLEGVPFTPEVATTISDCMKNLHEVHLEGFILKPTTVIMEVDQE